MIAAGVTDLTAEQQQIVLQPWDARTLVTAGAGTGKTHCLIHRLTHLIDQEELDAADILVLSFSRAAVREIRDRLADHGGFTSGVDVRTFDSYATLLLSEIDPDGRWQEAGYEGRIRSTVDLLRNREHAADLLLDLRHVVVDEIQDLVGERADLVRLILEGVDGGFTLLGDPAQGIYSFQLEDQEERIRGAAALYEWIRTTFRHELIEFSLTENFRVRGHEARVALRFGHPLGRADADFAGIQRDLRTELLDSDCLGDLHDAIPSLRESMSHTAILCRTNGDALVISRELHRQCVPHRLQRAAQDSLLPKWLALIFMRLNRSRPSRTEVLRILESAVIDKLSSELAWDLVKRMDRGRRDQAALDLANVRLQLARGAVPDELTRQAHGRLVVSTIHRAKGLEFDHVIVVDPGDQNGDLVDQAEGARTLYVAMTRPRDLLLWIKPVGSYAKQKLRQITRDDRWAECGYRGRFHRFGMEICGTDVHGEDPAGTTGYISDPRAIQSYLATEVPEGAPVELICLDEAEPRFPPRYEVRHNGVHIGVTSDDFGWALHRTLKVNSSWKVRRWPARIESIWVDAVETTTGSEAAGQNSGLGEFGVWLRPRLVGLGSFVWQEGQ